MRQNTALILLGAAIGIVAPFGAGGHLEPVQAQNQALPPEGFRIIGNIYWVGGEYGSYLITTSEGHILHDTGPSEMHDVAGSRAPVRFFGVLRPQVQRKSRCNFSRYPLGTYQHSSPIQWN